MKTNLLPPTLIVSVLLSFNVSATVHYVDLNCANPMWPYTSWSAAATNIQDAIDAAGESDLVLVTNGVYLAGGKIVHGALTNRVAVTRSMTVQSVNGPAMTVIEGCPQTEEYGFSARCVYLTNNAVLLGFTLTNGATSDHGDWVLDQSGGGVWCENTSAVVSNCVITYNVARAEGGGAYGGTFGNCTFTGNWAVYFGGAVSQGTLTNCLLFAGYAMAGGGANASTLKTCTIASNSATWGGGAKDSTLNDCLLSGNSADAGGGLSGGTANNCVLTGNDAGSGGGGASGAVLDACKVTENSSSYGGGADQCVLTNCAVRSNFSYNNGCGAYNSTLNGCILSGNTAEEGLTLAFSTANNSTLVGNGNGVYECILNNCILVDNDHSEGNNTFNCCCTTALPDQGTGNITNAPLFVNPDFGDFHLQSNSPCINAGNNAYVVTTSDFDGRPRVSGGTVDIGAYEFQNPASILSYAWLQQYGLPTDGSADYADTDGDGMNNWREWLADTSPLDANDYFHITSFNRDGTYNTLWWTSKSTRLYRVERCETLVGSPAWETIITNATPGWNNVGFDSTGSQYFYRVTAVQP